MEGPEEINSGVRFIGGCNVRLKSLTSFSAESHLMDFSQPFHCVSYMCMSFGAVVNRSIDYVVSAAIKGQHCRAE